jgi:hypothetical protein
MIEIQKLPSHIAMQTFLNCHLVNLPLYFKSLRQG